MGRINQLAEKTTLNSTDVIAVDAGAGGNTNKMTGANLAGQLKALGNYQDKLTFDSTPTAGSTNPVTSGGVKTALDGKQNTLTFDSTPTAGSTNPVTSGGVANAIQQSTAYTTGSVTPVGSGSSAQFMVVKQFGKVVSLYGAITGVTVGSSIKIGTISGVSAPATTVRTLCGVAANAYDHPQDVAYLAIYTTGEIYVASTQTGTKAVYFAVTYIA